MHELALSRAVVDAALRHCEGRRVTAVNLRVGTLRQVVPTSLEFYFAIVARGTPCEGARLEQEVVPARAACPACAREWELEYALFRCPACGAAGDVVAGEELEVESIEVEEGDEACIARR